VGPAAEHLMDVDLIVAAPLTLNTLSKIALGLCDNAVSLLLASHIGRKGRVLYIPAMSMDLRIHPLYDRYRSTLMEWGGVFLESAPEEGRLKIPPPEAVAARVIEIVSRKPR
jgi:phosphopantothenoylcysteine decarboxylase/phosphopantothenate--cysteine ligase